MLSLPACLPACLHLCRYLSVKMISILVAGSLCAAHLLLPPSHLHVRQVGSRSCLKGMEGRRERERAFLREEGREHIQSCSARAEKGARSGVGAKLGEGGW